MASFKLHVTASELIRKSKTEGGAVDERKTKDTYRREKDLEEDRKLGLEPATIDVDTGRDINPHIPQFITQTPWYVPTSGPTLKHQRPHPERQKEQTAVEQWYQRGTTGKSANTFRKGACENCGAMTHKKKDCFERPRKLGAKVTGEDIAPDEYIQPKLTLDFEGKRDRWNGYDPAMYTEVIKEHEKQEEVRKIIKAEQNVGVHRGELEAIATIKADQLKEQQGEGLEGAATPRRPEEEEDEDKYAEDADMAGVSVDMDSRTRITVRNLRIREDTAKYLYNLSENAPYYDPKSRSMRENPFAGMAGKEKEAAKFAGENFIRYTGEVVDANEAQVFAWQARCQGIDVHALAEPTKLEQLRKEMKKETKNEKEDTKKSLLEKYGGSEHLAAPPKELLLAQSESYVEYSRKGKVIKGEERPLIKSRYEEDIYPGNHTSIFGSYWENGRWGYRCCHSMVRNSYCIGEQGYSVNKEMEAIPMVKVDKKEEAGTSKEEEKEEKKEEEKPKKEEKPESSSSSSSSEEEEEEDDEDEETRNQRIKEEEIEREKKKLARDERRRAKKRERRKKQKLEGRKRKHSTSPSSSDSDEDEEKKKKKEDDPLEILMAVKKYKKVQKKNEKEANKDDRKRKYNTTYESKQPTELEMEAYKITQIHASDPMASYLQKKKK